MILDCIRQDGVQEKYGGVCGVSYPIVGESGVRCMALISRGAVPPLNHALFSRKLAHMLCRGCGRHAFVWGLIYGWFEPGTDSSNLRGQVQLRSG